jgi:hypothetical protein
MSIDEHMAVRIQGDFLELADAYFDFDLAKIVTGI